MLIDFRIIILQNEYFLLITLLYFYSTKVVDAWRAFSQCITVTWDLLINPECRIDAEKFVFQSWKSVTMTLTSRSNGGWTDHSSSSGKVAHHKHVRAAHLLLFLISDQRPQVLRCPHLQHTDGIYMSRPCFKQRRLEMRGTEHCSLSLPLLFLSPRPPGPALSSSPPTRFTTAVQQLRSRNELYIPLLKASKQWYKQTKGLEGPNDDKMMRGVRRKRCNNARKGRTVVFLSILFKGRTGGRIWGLWDTEMPFFLTATVTINSTITFSFSLTCAVASMAREER